MESSYSYKGVGMLPEAVRGEGKNSVRVRKEARAGKEEGKALTKEKKRSA